MNREKKFPENSKKKKKIGGGGGNGVGGGGGGGRGVRLRGGAGGDVNGEVKFLNFHKKKWGVGSGGGGRGVRVNVNEELKFL